MRKKRQRFILGLSAILADELMDIDFIEREHLAPWFALNVPRALDVCRDIRGSALTDLMMTDKFDYRAPGLPIVFFDMGVQTLIDLEFGLGYNFQETPLKAVDVICILYGNSLHILSFQLLRVKSDNYSKLSAKNQYQINIFRLMSYAYFSSIAEGPWHVFRIWDIQRACYLEASERRALCRELGLAHVPVVEEACPVFDRFTSMDSLLAFAEGKTIHDHEREGLVFKEIGTTHPVTFKVVSNKYLLKMK